MAQSVATMAMVFYLFVTLNQLAYLAIFELSNYFAVLYRVSSVLRLEEYKHRSGGEISSGHGVDRHLPRPASTEGAELPDTERTLINTNTEAQPTS